MKEINKNEPYTHGVIIENPKNKSDINITNKGKLIPNHLFLNITPPKIASDVIGAKLGGCGTNLKRIANTQNTNTNNSLLFIIIKFAVSTGFEPVPRTVTGWNCNHSTMRPTAEKEGFEPPLPFSKTVFKTAAFNRSATSPL